MGRVGHEVRRRRLLFRIRSPAGWRRGRVAAGLRRTSVSPSADALAASLHRQRFVSMHRAAAGVCAKREPAGRAWISASGHEMWPGSGRIAHRRGAGGARQCGWPGKSRRGVAKNYSDRARRAARLQQARRADFARRAMLRRSVEVLRLRRGERAQLELAVVVEEPVFEQFDLADRVEQTRRWGRQRRRVT